MAVQNCDDNRQSYILFSWQGKEKLKIYEIHDLSNLEIVDLLTNALSEVDNPNIVQNYHPDYQHVPGNLFYILREGRYKRGMGKYFIVTVDDKYVCSAGWNEYELDSTIALLLTRMYITPTYRGKYIIGNNILPQCIQEASNHKQLWITSNEHNKSIYTYFERANQNKRTALFNDWPEIYKRFKPIGKKTIYYTEQWVAEYDKRTSN